MPKTTTSQKKKRTRKTKNTQKQSVQVTIDNSKKSRRVVLPIKSPVPTTPQTLYVGSAQPQPSILANRSSYDATRDQSIFTKLGEQEKEIERLASLMTKRRQERIKEVQTPMKKPVTSYFGNGKQEATGFNPLATPTKPAPGKNSDESKNEGGGLLSNLNPFRRRIDFTVDFNDPSSIGNAYIKTLKSRDQLLDVLRQSGADLEKYYGKKGVVKSGVTVDMLQRDVIGLNLDIGVLSQYIRNATSGLQATPPGKGDGTGRDDKPDDGDLP